MGTFTKIRQEEVTLVMNGQIYWAFYVRTQVHFTVAATQISHYSAAVEQ